VISWKGRQVLQRDDRLFRLIKAFARVVLSRFYRIEIVGQDRLPPKAAFVLLPKHQRWQDIPIIALAAPRPLYYVAKHELFANPLTRWFLASLGGIPLNRDEPIKSRESIRTVMAALKSGEGVVVFPEGTYYLNRMGPGKPGLVRLIIGRTAAPLIPAGLRYREGKGKTEVHVCFGAPIYPDASGPSRSALDRVMREIAVLSGLEEA